MQGVLPSETRVAMLSELPPKPVQMQMQQLFAPKFRQVVQLASENLKQVCNFLRRCRSERSIHKYLVFLDFLPHRDTLHFLHVAPSLNCTVIVCGGFCARRAVRELYNDLYAVIEPVGSAWCVQTLPSRDRRTLLAFAESASHEAHCSFVAWKERRKPELYNADSFTSFSMAKPSAPRNDSRRTHSARGGANTSTPSRQCKEACETLGLTEAEATSNAAAVSRAYKRRAIACHPDKHPAAGKARDDAAARFMAIGAARDFLMATFHSA